MGKASKRSAAQGVVEKIGLMGGTFDPVHQGHLDCAQAAADQLGLDQVLFIPAGVPVYKLDKPVTAAEHRVAMVRLAIKGRGKFALDTREVTRGGKTYTADTLRELRQDYPQDTQFVLIAGVDAALTVPHWRESEVIAREARIAVVTRPGYLVNRCSSAYQQLVDSFLVSWVEADTMDVSSSQVRAMIAQGEDVSNLVPSRVVAYLQEHELYKCHCEEKTREGGSGMATTEGERLVAIYRAAAGIEPEVKAEVEAEVEPQAEAGEPKKSKKAKKAAKKAKKAAKKAAKKEEKKAAKKAKKSKKAEKKAKKSKKAEKKAKKSKKK